MPSRTSIAVCLFSVAAACAGIPERNRLRGVLPQLGYGFGEMITVEGEFVPASGGKGSAGPRVRVMRSEGSAAYDGVELDLMFRQSIPPWSVDRDQHCGGMQPGVVYRLRGYESGTYRGEVEWPVSDFDFGPRQVLRFQFQSWFVVVSIEPMASSTRAGA
jgi:hypothetical protein